MIYFDVKLVFPLMRSFAMHGFAKFFLLILIIIFAICLSFATDDVFSITKNLDLINFSPKAAVNAKTGDVLVAWRRMDPNDQDSSCVYSSLCKKLKSGEYSIKGTKVLSRPSNTCLYGPDIAYNPDDNSYMVVWASGRADPKYGTIWAVRSRRVNSKGKPDKKIKDYFIEGNHQIYPVISFMSHEESISSCRNRNGAYIIAYGNNIGETKGLYTRIIGSDGSPVSDPEQVIQGNPQFVCYPTKIVQVGQGTYFIAFIDYDPKAGHAASVVTVNSTGEYIREGKIGSVSSRDADIVQLSNKLFLGTFDKEKTGSQGIYHNQRFNAKLKKKKGSFSPSKKMDALSSRLIKLNKYEGALQLWTTGLQIYNRLIDSKGQFDGKEKYTVQSKGMRIESLHALCLPESNTVFLVWSEWVDNNRAEVRGYLFDAVQ